MSPGNHLPTVPIARLAPTVVGVLSFPLCWNRFDLMISICDLDYDKLRSLLNYLLQVPSHISYIFA
jgi:hypothetical protein